MCHTHYFSKRRRKRQERPVYAKRVLALGIALALLTALSAQGVQAKTFEEVLEESLEWLAANTDYAIPDFRPEVEFAATEEINRRYYGSAYTNQDDVTGLFVHSKRGTIYFPDISPEVPGESLVHELVHFLQKASGEFQRKKDDCRYWTEVEAYDVQMQWMIDHAYPEELVLKAKERKLAFEAFCNQRDKILNGVLLWDLAWKFYCPAHEDAEAVFSGNESGLEIAGRILAQNVLHEKRSCSRFREGDVGYVVRLIKSETIAFDIYRLVEARIRNGEDNGDFTKRVYVLTLGEFTPPQRFTR